MSSSWKFAQPTQSLGSHWRDPSYDDSMWAAGQGVLAVENSSNSLVYPQIRTALSLGTLTRIKTYYFRKHFTLTENPYLVQVIITNLVDDGAIFYVNGQEFLRNNMPTGPVDFTTGANSSIEATYTSATIPCTLLVNGDNVLAVEVHNASTNSDDVVFGLAATVVHPAPSPLVITNQPANVRAAEDSQVTFTVGISGSPVNSVQWYRRGTAVPGANQLSYSIGPLQLSDSGASYYAVVGNTLGSVTSRWASVEVFADTDGPLITSAESIEYANQVTVSFNERLDPVTGGNLANYTITNLGGNNLVLTSVLLQNGTNVVLTTSAPLLPNTNYLVTVRNVFDASHRSNSIAANSSFPIARVIPLIDEYSKCFYYNPDPFFGDDPEPTNTWRKTSFFPYVDDVNRPWGDNDYVRGILWSGPGELPGAQGSELQQTDSATIYFVYPFGFFGSPLGAEFRFRYLAEDAAIFYINGPEFLRTNLPSGPVSWSTTAQTVRSPATWTDAPGLLSLPIKYGTNNLAAELHTASIVADRFAFAPQLSVRISSYPVGPVVITHQPTNLVVMEGRPATFSFFGAGPLTFQWASNGVAIAGATNPAYTIPAVSYVMLSNRYSVVASNKSYWARSSDATLTVIPDTNAPALLSAFCVSSNQILVTFSEAVTPGSAQNLANYAITNSAFPPLTIQSAALTNGTNVLLTVTPANGSDYTLVVNNVKDVSAGNQVYPNSNVKIGIKVSIPIDSTWLYNEMGTNMPSSWSSPAYNDSFWPSGPALLFYEDAILPAGKGTQLWLRNPDDIFVPTFYFRQHLPLAVGASKASLSLRHVIDDGAIVYLNGNEIHRFNMAGGPVNHQTLASTNVIDATWSPATDAYKISLTNVLQGGNNIIAAEVHQSSISSADICFGLEMSIAAPSGCAGILIGDGFDKLQVSRLSDGKIFLNWISTNSVLTKSENLFISDSGWATIATGVTSYVVLPDLNKRQVFYRLRPPALFSSDFCIPNYDP